VPAPGMTQKQIDKELERQKVIFEERCRTGQLLDGSIRFADFAMYEVKHTYKGRIKEFDRISYEKNYYLLDKSEAFNELIEKKLIYFDFQPIVDVASAGVIGYEALMRPMCKDFKTPYEILNIARTQAKLYEVEKLTVFGVLDYMMVYSNSLNDKKIFFNSISNLDLYVGYK
jgi:predicted signal transduction protein with EAL and GGDEF domain